MWTKESRKEGRRVFQVTFTTHIAVNEGDVAYSLQNLIKKSQVSPEAINETVDNILRKEVSNIAEKLGEMPEIVAQDWDIEYKPVEDSFSIEHVTNPRSEVEVDPGHPDLGIGPEVVPKED